MEAPLIVKTVGRPARLGGHQEASGFCLIALGDARGHETGKQENRFANPRHEMLC